MVVSYEQDEEFRVTNRFVSFDSHNQHGRHVPFCNVSVADEPAPHGAGLVCDSAYQAED